MGGFCGPTRLTACSPSSLLTLVLGGVGAWATGRAMAQTWRPLAMLALYMILLAAGGALSSLCALR